MLSVDVAEAIVNEAKSAGIDTDPMPATDDAKLERANHWVQQANHAYENEKIRSDVVVRIRQMAMGEGLILPAPAPPPEPNVAGSTDAVIEDIRRQRLPIPPDLEGDPEEVPHDLSTLKDAQLRRLHGVYGVGYLPRAIWLLGVEKGRLEDALRLRDWEYSLAHRAIDKMDSVTGKPKLAEVMKMEAEANPIVRKLDQRIAEHRRGVVMYQTLHDIYKGTVDRLSRESSMREAEYARHGGGRSS